MKRVSIYEETKPYETKDSSQIRELIHPQQHKNHNQSIAEAKIAPGAKTISHHHKVSEEIYLTTGGSGKLYIKKTGGGCDEIEIELHKGTSAVILPGEYHWLKNTGEGELVILCCCSPPYSHEDTFLEPDGS
jgi:mannose-6-phosphate isomerase-like protein (cupin superfamily)